MQNDRRTISAGELYVMLDREFRLRQSRQCKSCYILLPYRIDQREEGEANWEIVMPPDCPFECTRVMEEIVNEYSLVYNLAPEPAAGE